MGGEFGYSRFLEVIKNPKHPDQKNVMMWMDGSFDPELVDINQINYKIDLVAQQLNDWNVRLNLWIDDPMDWVDPNLRVKNWLKTLQKRDWKKFNFCL